MAGKNHYYALNIMKYLKILSIFPIFLFVLLCSIENNPVETVRVQKKEINGLVQKGPFINGTSILINELKNDLSQTGKTYSTQITDIKGNFDIKNIELLSNFVSLTASGFYYNEITGQQSDSQMTLYAISDISGNSTVNVNILSHLEKARVEYLISVGMEFQAAKKQAQTEILDIFKISPRSINPSEMLDISRDGDGNAILLAISLIMQGYSSEGYLTELLADMSADITTDGELNNTAIRNNLESRYSDSGADVEIPEFEKYIKIFIDSTDFESTHPVSYPPEGKWGINILNTSDSVFTSGNCYSMAARLLPNTTLTVRHNGNLTSALKFPLGQDNTGWQDLGPDASVVWRTYKTSRTGAVYIYENGTESPARIKKLYKSAR